MLGHKANLRKFKKIKIMLINFSNNNSIKLEIHNKRKHGKSTNMCKLKNVLLKTNGLKKSKEKSKIP